MNNQERLYLVKAARAKAIGNFFSGVGNKVKGLFDFDGKKLKRDQAHVDHLQELEDIHMDDLLMRNKGLIDDGFDASSRKVKLLPGPGLRDRFRPDLYGDNIIPKKNLVDVAKQEIPNLHKDVKPPVSRHR